MDPRAVSLRFGAAADFVRLAKLDILRVWVSGTSKPTHNCSTLWLDSTARDDEMGGGGGRIHAKEKS